MAPFSFGRDHNTKNGVAKGENISVGYFVLPTPPDGYFLFSSLLAARDTVSWMVGKTPIGFQTDLRLERIQTQEAQQMKR